MGHTRLAHRFVEHVPERLDPGVLYISMEYGTVAHSCCCGCGEEVVTPLTPTDWKMTYDGETVSLHPSVGSWTLPCRSHYVITQGKVIEAGSWTEAQIAAERRRDHIAKARHYGEPEPAMLPPAALIPSVSTEATPVPGGLLDRVWRWLRGWRS